MWKLKLPSKRDAINNIDTALTLKSGVKKYSITEAEKGEVKKIYDEYELTKGVANNKLKGLTLNPVLLLAFENAYGQVQEGGRLKKLRDRLFLNAKMCPCCGILVPDELDHHLPIKKYQALGIYSSNLIPYCHKCNNKKRSVDGIDPNERFIHVYYDNIPVDKQFLLADVKIVGKALKISLRVIQIPELDKQLFTQMNFQMQKVDLNKRLLKELSTYLSSVASYIQSDYENGGKSAVKDNLLKASINLGKQFGINHWRHVVIKTLANYEKFCDGGFYEPLSLVRPAAIKQPK